MEQFRKDGFLFVDHAVLDTADVLEARQLSDGLFASWDKIPRWLAPNVAGDAPVLEIKYAMSLAPGLRHIRMVKACRKLAAEVLGVKHVWCHFDHTIYKHPGAEPIAWHQDLVASRTGLNERAVHFWIPLHDLTPESGGMMFVPGSHTGELLEHVPQHQVGGARYGSSHLKATLISLRKRCRWAGSRSTHRVRYCVSR